MAAKTPLKTVPDTNVVLASEMSSDPESPNREYFERWKNGDFSILFSGDTLLEYIEKLQDKAIPAEAIKSFLSSVLSLGVEVYIEHFHFPVYPLDIDDVAFILCADNGGATHLVTYDRHLLDLADHYPFRICGTVDFLRDLRQELPQGVEQVEQRP